MTLLQIIDDKKKITGKKSIITACNVDYRLKRSGPKILQKSILKKKHHLHFLIFYKSVCGLHTYIYVEKKVLGGPDSLLLKNGGC